MCAHCHNTKTMAVDRPGGSGVAFKGCDVNGMPIDANHPFYSGVYPCKDGSPRRYDRRDARKIVS
jgi:hypothetical protein